MKEYPILFSGPMVRAILEGRKTQTRRIIKGDSGLLNYSPHQVFMRGAWYPTSPSGKIGLVPPVKCPYGEPGDILRVTEPDNPDSEAYIELEITNVRVERLQDISDADAKAEGAILSAKVLDYHHAFREIWEYIKGEGSWNENPWVWVIEFKKVR